MFDTLSTSELLRWPGETLLTRLFSEDEPQLLGERPLQFGCSCSRERVEAMIASLGPDEARAAVIDGEAHVVCEFCGRDYRFSPDEVERVLGASDEAVDAPARTQ